MPTRLACLGAVFLFLLTVVEGALAPIEQKITAAADAISGEFVRDLEAAVLIDSATENIPGVRKMAEFFGGKLAPLGFATRFAELPASTLRAGHLVAELPGARGKRILLLGHLDTVLPGGKFRVEGDRAYGSGTSDMKGGNLVLIYALRALQAAGVLEGCRLTVVITGDEESTGKPQEVARRELLAAARSNDVVLSFEAAIGHTATVARRGFMGWTVEVQGATGHSAGMFSPAMGAGAVFEAARILEGFYTELRQLEGLTINPALIAGGTEATVDGTNGVVSGKANIIAQRTVITGELRTLNADQLREAQKRMQTIIAKNLPRTSATLTFGENFPAMAEAPANYALLAELDRASRDLGFPAITAFDPRGRGAGDISFVAPPLPGLDGLGIRGGGSHGPTEWADLATVPELIKRTALLIHRLAQL